MYSDHIYQNKVAKTTKFKGLM